MDFPTEMPTLLQNLQTYMMTSGSTLPDFLRSKLIEASSSPSPVDRIVRSAEALYACSADLDDAGKTICAQLASFAAMNGWHGMGLDNRGGQIAQAMQRDTGEKAPMGSWPKADSDPAPLDEFVAPAAEDPAGEPAPVVPAPVPTADS